MPVKRPTKRPAKLENVLQVVREYIAAGRYRITTHAAQRMAERSVVVRELIDALQRADAFHEKSKDTFNDLDKSWDYAIRSKADDGRRFRIVIAIAEGVILVTVIDLERKGDDND
jgi:hypothetical protein